MRILSASEQYGADQGYWALREATVALRQASVLLAEYQYVLPGMSPAKLRRDTEQAHWDKEQELLDRLQHEFDDWWGRLPQRRKGDPYSSGTNWTYFPDQPVTHWRNVEKFLKDRYPGSALGQAYGMEDAEPLMEDKLSDQSGGKGDEVSAAMLRLHNLAQGRGYDTSYPDPLHRFMWERRTEPLVHMVQDEERAV